MQLSAKSPDERYHLGTFKRTVGADQIWQDEWRGQRLQRQEIQYHLRSHPAVLRRGHFGEPNRRLHQQQQIGSAGGFQGIQARAEYQQSATSWELEQKRHCFSIARASTTRSSKPMMRPSG